MADLVGQPDLATGLRDVANALVELLQCEDALAHFGRGGPNRRLLARLFPHLLLLLER